MMENKIEQTTDEGKTDRIIVDLLVITTCILIGPVITALVVMSMITQDLLYFPTISYAIQLWPNITSMIIGTAATNILTVVLITAHTQEGRDKRASFLAYLSLLALWATVGTAIPQRSISVDILHSVTALFFFVASTLLVLHLMSRFHQESQILKTFLLCSVIACLVFSVMMLVYSTPYSSLGFGELAFLWIYAVILAHVFLFRA